MLVDKTISIEIGHCVVALLSLPGVIGGREDIEVERIGLPITIQVTRDGKRGRGWRHGRRRSGCGSACDREAGCWC